MSGTLEYLYGASGHLGGSSVQGHNGSVYSQKILLPHWPNAFKLIQLITQRKVEIIENITLNQYPKKARNKSKFEINNCKRKNMQKRRTYVRQGKLTN